MQYTKLQLAELLRKTQKFIGQKGFDNDKQVIAEVIEVYEENGDILIKLMREDDGEVNVNIKYFNENIRDNLLRV
jgi:hypothetical protein